MQLRISHPWQECLRSVASLAKDIDSDKYLPTHNEEEPFIMPVVSLSLFMDAQWFFFFSAIVNVKS